MRFLVYMLWSMELFGFDRVEQFILDVSLCVETSRDLCERVCQDLRPLLHRPWPPKGKSLKSAVLPADGDEGNRGDAASLEEAETLAEVERALVKAQKAREVHRRLNPSEKICQEVDASQPDGNLPAEDNPRTKPTSQIINGQEFAVISQSSLQKLFADVRPQNPNKNSRTVDKNTNLAHKPRPGTAQARAAYSVKVPRPHPSTKSQFKTSSSDIGRNVVNKPKANSASKKYGNSKRTIVEENVSKEVADQKRNDRSLTSNSSNRFKKPVTTGSKRQQSHAKESPLDNQMGERPRSDTKQTTSGAAVKVKRAGPFPETSEVVCQNSSNEGMRGAYNQSAPGMDNLVQKTAKLRLGDDSMPKPPTSYGMGDIRVSANKENLFMLKRDGCDLKVPGKLKKLHSDISKLRLRLSSEMTSDKETLPSQHYLHRLESKFQPSSTLLSFRDVQEKMDELAAECRHLIQVAKSTIKTFPKQDATCDSRYRIKVLTKAIRTKLDQLKMQVENIIAAEKQLVSSAHPRLPSLNPPNPPECRTCEGASIKPSITFFLPVQHGDLQSCIMQLGISDQGSHRNYEYSHLKELQRLSTLQHDVQRLGLQIQLEKLIGDEMLPILENLDPSDDSFIPLYRSLFGLLCHGGKVYPAVVRDSIGNVSEIEPT